MPIEIRELVIKAMVAQPEGTSSGAAGSSGGNNNTSLSEEIIAACVEKILDILKEKNER